MTQSAPDWNLYRSFLAVLETGSLSGAARELEITQPTVGRHVDALEAALGAALFTRGRGGLTPTDTALDLKPHAVAMANAAAALRRGASGTAEEPRGTVRLAAAEAVGCEVLPEILARFRHRHPGVALELVLSDRMSDLLTREADIAVRMQRPEQGSLIARRVGRVGIGLYAHRDYVARRGLPRTLEALGRHSGIGYDRETWLYRTLGGRTPPLDPDSFDFRTDYYAAQSAALRAGLGIGGMQRPLAARHPELVPVLPEAFDVSLEMWLAMHEDLRPVRRVRLLFDFLAAELAAYCRGGTRTDEGRDGDGVSAG